MSIITLTTDLGLNDHYVASVKANILRQIPEAKIVDITHLVSPFNISHAGYVVKNCYKESPPKSIHIIGVETELKEMRHLNSLRRMIIPKITHISFIL